MASGNSSHCENSSPSKIFGDFGDFDDFFRNNRLEGDAEEALRARGLAKDVVVGVFTVEGRRGRRGRRGKRGRSDQSRANWA